jgi:hypothetical protein
MRKVGVLLALVVGSLCLSPGATDAYQSSGIGVVTAVSGPVSMIRAAAQPQPLKFRDQLQWRDVVETKKDGSARILLLGTTSVTVRELSRLELREEALAAGKKYTVSVVSGKVRATVERTLLGKGEEVEVHSPNAVAAVRGTDLVVEIAEQPARARGLGLLASLAGPLLAQAPTAGTTVVYALSGQVNVFNPTSTARRVETLGALEGARIQGRSDPTRFTFTRLEISNILRGLNPPPPPAANRPVASDSAKTKVEQLATIETTRTGERPGVVPPTGGGPAPTFARSGDQPSGGSAPGGGPSGTTGGPGFVSGGGTPSGGFTGGPGTGASPAGSGAAGGRSVSSGSGGGAVAAGAGKSVPSVSGSTGSFRGTSGGAYSSGAKYSSSGKYNVIPRTTITNELLRRGTQPKP